MPVLRRSEPEERVVMMSHAPCVHVIMPVVFCADDGGWIQEQLVKLGSVTRGKIAMQYAEVYQSTWDAEPVSYRKENRARFAANTRLREYMRKYSEAGAGYTVAAPLVK